ncbi:uncharacterized protein PODANS_7_2240 [Podospora anserina S mat+]|uniref:Podospora anserina S mat+ genomic DNA chromosome 7, supercontig 1 n=1 Tax=Podospora anserina (strain S / ATCC MYA-4624 / DSM 980 / FGSC 10383) TaxID=515849 RepID=B2AVP2_PODAN|nr:uncharacterized protein PODANS_7_2240 [Podospora anserina S mat+]CAP68466.1 unnamed protein product [Podospora anserina S mat+]CDP31938.1 Putative protein of unknown function [Podospora anserina S mat+]
MSADLFAAFADTPSSTAPQQQQTKPAQDSLSFLDFASPAPQPQTQAQISQQSAPWPPIQQLAPTQGSSFASAQFGHPQTNNSNVWGDLGGSGGFQRQSATTQAPSKTSTPVQDDQEDEDDWGDFEAATKPADPPQPPAPLTNITSPPSRTRVTRASTMDLMGNQLFNLGLEDSHKPKRNPDPDVLFDADFEAENGDINEDDFGDFEAVPAPVTEPTTTKPVDDLLGLDVDSAPSSKKAPPGLSLSNAAFHGSPSAYPKAPKSPYGSSFHDRKPDLVKELQVKPPTGVRNIQEANQASPSPITAWPEVGDGFGNKWEEFKDIPDTTTKPAIKTASQPKIKTTSKSKPAPAPTTNSEWEWQDWGATEEKAPQHSNPPAQPAPSHEPRGPPPTNIPPPSVLLSLCPQLLDLATTTLLKPLLTLSTTSPGYQRIIGSAQTLAFIKAYLALATVVSRLIAGRKQRWHRDKFLSQSMTISAAVAGGKPGMKLAGIDKTQSIREEQEVAEVIEVWKKQVGRLRGVVAAMNSAHHENLKIPELATNMAVTAAKNVPTAPKACVVCGLKRDERVAKVDYEVEDSFGEWWIEFWGHRQCANFWVEHEKELRQR